MPHLCCCPPAVRVHAHGHSHVDSHPLGYVDSHLLGHVPPSSTPPAAADARPGTRAAARRPSWARRPRCRWISAPAAQPWTASETASSCSFLLLRLLLRLRLRLRLLLATVFSSASLFRRLAWRCEAFRAVRLCLPVRSQQQRRIAGRLSTANGQQTSCWTTCRQRQLE